MDEQMLNGQLPHPFSSWGSQNAAAATGPRSMHLAWACCLRPLQPNFESEEAYMETHFRSPLPHPHKSWCRCVTPGTPLATTEQFNNLKWPPPSGLNNHHTVLTSSMQLPGHRCHHTEMKEEVCRVYRIEGLRFTPLFFLSFFSKEKISTKNKKHFIKK